MSWGCSRSRLWGALLAGLFSSAPVLAGCETVELEPEPLASPEPQGQTTSRSSAGAPHPLPRLSRQLAPSASPWSLASARSPVVRLVASVPRSSSSAAPPHRKAAAPLTASAPMAAARSRSAPSPEGEAATGEASGPAPLIVRRLVITDAISNREPVQRQQLQVGNDPILAFVELESSAGQAHPIVVTFEHESGAQAGFVELEIPPKQRRWRTWASTRRLTRSGKWAAVVRSAQGELLSRKSFTLVSPSRVPQPAASAVSR